MEAACKGAMDGEGTSIGILPKLDVSLANEFATVVLPTDLGNHSNPVTNRTDRDGIRDINRNLIIVSSAKVVVAIGGGNGTRNEIKLALQNGKTVITVLNTPKPDCLRKCEPRFSGKTVSADSSEEAIAKVLKYLT